MKGHFDQVPSMGKTCEICGKEHFMFPWETKCYACRSKGHQKQVITDIQNGDAIDTNCENDIFCPWCGYIYEVDCEYELYEEGDHDIVCPECSKRFIVTVDISYSYDTRRPDHDED